MSTLAPWTRSTGIESVVDAWLASGSVRPCFAIEKLIEPKPARYAKVPKSLPPALKEALLKRGINSLYSHQAEAVEAALNGEHVVIATPTASGKSLCFHLPVLSAIVKDPSANAIYLYPTKALSRDQEHSIQQLARDAGLDIPAMVYDGDTPGDARRAVRERCRIVLSNPDMLHSGILPNHARWSTLFQNLKYVILDELHTYRGVFGSHMAHVLARLQRIANFHGSNPQFVCATATIGNPKEHAARLLGVDPSAVKLVDSSGAPQASRQVFIYNPPIVNAELGVRGSALKHAVSLAADLVKAKVPTIVFGPSRNSVEVMLKYLRERTSKWVTPDAIMAYRGGYLPATRRGIEQGLRNGEILCVVATNALELGIDIGDLEAVICVGYPGSIAATWQRFGRAGRRGSKSIAALVCNSHALDQFLAREPEYLLRSGAEEARIDPKNPEILLSHLKCATFEAPFAVTAPGPRLAAPEAPAGEDYAGLGHTGTRDALEYLRGHGLIHHNAGRYYWSGDPYPATHVSLRNIGWDNFVIIDVNTNRSLAELDWRAAHTMLHEQAIYQHDAEQYQVERLDYENHKAFVRKVEPDYFTTALTYRTVEVLETNESRELLPEHEASLNQSGAAADGYATIGLGEVKVLEKVTGYKKIKFFTHENAGYGDVHLPEMQMHTTSFWLTIPNTLLDAMEREAQGTSLFVSRAALVDALRAAGSALETVSTLALMCEPRDINRTLGDGDGRPDEVSPAAASSKLSPDGNSPDGDRPLTTSSGSKGPIRNPFTSQIGRFDPTLFLFDAQPGGVGLAPRIYERAPELLQNALSLIERCACKNGCPGCIGPTESGRERKALAAALLRKVTQQSSL